MALDFSIGRRRELSRLAELLGRAVERGPLLACVEGSGADALVDAFVARARAKDAHVIDATSDGTAFSPIDVIVASALALGAHGASARALGCPHGCHALWFEHSGSTAGAADAEQAGVERRERARALRDLLGSRARAGATVVVLRALDRASSEALALVSDLLELDDGVGRVFPLLFVVTHDGCAALAPAIENHPRTAKVALEALDPDGLKDLLSSPEVVAKILSATGGLPARIERLLEAAPPSAESYLEERVGALDEAAQRAFEALAVLGGPATIDEIARALGTAPSLSLRVALEGAGLVDAVGERLVLRSSLDRALVLESIAVPRRRALHERAIVLSLESGRYMDAIEHAFAVEDRARIVEVAMRGVDALGARGAHLEAAALLRRVSQAVPEASAADKSALDGELVDALLAAGELGAAVGPARRAYERDGSIRTARRLCRALLASGDLDAARDVIESARERAGSAEPSSERAEIIGLAAELAYQTGRLSEAGALAVETITVATDAGDARVILAAMQTAAKVALAEGRLEDALSAYERYAEAARAHGDLAHEALASGGRGVVQITRGDLTDAEQALRACAEIGARGGSKKALALAKHNLAVVAHLHHDYATARERYEEAIELLAVVGNKPSLARAAFNLGELYETFGAIGRARAMSDFGAQVGGKSVPARAMAEGLLLRGRVDFDAEDLVSARAAFEAARRSLADVDPIRACAAIVGLARVAVREGELDEAESLLRDVPDTVPGARRAELALAEAELADARSVRATDSALHAVSIAETSDDERFLLEALLHLAKVELECGKSADAQRALARASRVDASLGARVPADLRQAWEDRPARRALLALVARGRVVGARTDVEERGARLGIVGRSPAIERVVSVVERVGPSDVNVLVRGESGTGKELVARALHAVSSRKGGPLVAVNCAALVDSLLLSELFGHEKGAFTGAHERRRGRFELAHGGTLFLDEIGDVSPAVQAALLRVLQERTFERIGGRETIHVDVRVVAATNRDLATMVRSGTFREDLYYRLNELVIALPPLRERAADVPLLAELFLARIGEERGEPPKRLSNRALRLAVDYSWPGNVRQLENVLRAATLFADADVVDVEHLDIQGIRTEPDGAASAVHARPVVQGDEVELCYARLRSGEVTLRDLKKDLERELLERALGECDGNISRAAALLGMKRPRVSQLVKEYGLRSWGDES